MQDAQKAVWSIPCVSVAFFSYGILLHILLLKCPHVQIPFSRVYSNCCFSCSFESEIIKIDQSYDKMYSNNILNFTESTTILNTCTKKSGNLLKEPRIFSIWIIPNSSSIDIQYIYICIYIYIYIIIMSHNQQGYPWPSLATPPYRPLLSAGPRHWAAVFRFELVVLPLFVHVKRSTGVHHLWSHPYFSTSVPNVWLVQFR